MTRWIDDYMAIPFRDGGRGRLACDCYGLVSLILRDRAGIVLEAHEAVSALDVKAVEGAISKDAAEWQSVKRGDEREFDVVTMRGVYDMNGEVRSAECHMGIVTKLGWLVHTEAKTGVVHVSLTHPAVRGRIMNVYRHRSLA